MNPLPLDIKVTILVALLLMVTIVVFLIFITILYNRRQTISEKEKKLEAMEYRTKLLQKEIDFQNLAKYEQERLSNDMHDDLGAGISAIKLQAEFIKRKVTDAEIAKNLDELLESCADLSSSLRQVLWNIKPGNVTLPEFTERISQYAHTFFAKSSIRVYIVRDELTSAHISADSRRNLFLCVKELLNNIYKHSQCDNVTVYFYQKERAFNIDVKDDGVGLSENVEYGHGLENMVSRMESIGGTFRFIPVDKGLHVSLSVQVEAEETVEM